MYRRMNHAGNESQTLRIRVFFMHYAGVIYEKPLHHSVCKVIVLDLRAVSFHSLTLRKQADNGDSNSIISRLALGQLFIRQSSFIRLLIQHHAAKWSARLQQEKSTNPYINSAIF